MSFTITIDFDLTPEDLELLKGIGERVNYSIGHAGKRRLDNTTIKPITEAQAVKDLLREALRAKRKALIETTAEGIANSPELKRAVMDSIIYGAAFIPKPADPQATDLDSEDIDEGLTGGGE